LSKELPAFHRPTIDGRGFDTVLLRGKPVVVKFFAQYCEPCKKTLPAAERLHRDNPDVTFVGIDVDDYSTTAMKMTSAYGLTFPVIHDTGQVLKGRFRVADLPVTFVADRQGVVRWIGGPGQTERDLEQALGAVSAQ
jgi:thiol-disulfide isomerase/thioredoxin